jgi:prefoldin subunit 5
MAEEGKTLSALPDLVPPAAFMEDVKAYMEGGGRARGCQSPLGLLVAHAADLCRHLTALPAARPSLILRCAGKNTEEVLTELRASHQKYKYIEAEIVQRKRRLAFKQPEIQKCLAAVNLLLQRQEAGESVSAIACTSCCDSCRSPLSCRQDELHVKPVVPPPLLPSTPHHPPLTAGLPPLLCLPAPAILAAPSPQTVLDFSLSDQVYARARVADVEAVNLWLGAGVMLEYSLADAQALLERQLAGCKQQLEVVQWEHEYIKDQLTTTEVGWREGGGEGG